MPQSNTLFFGAMPKLPSLEKTRKLINPIVAEVDDTHPLFRYVNMENVLIVESILPDLPEGTRALVESGDGPLVFLLTRDGFSDCVFGFGVYRTVSSGRELNTDWFSEYSFPLFMFNTLRVLGNVQDSISEEVILPGQTISLRSDSVVQEITINDPNRTKYVERRNAQGVFLFNRTDRVGVYQFGPIKRDGDKYVQQRFAVNLFDARESDIAPRSNIGIGYEPVQSSTKVNRSRRESWRWLVLAVFAVLLTEWYVYNRRVYI